MLGMISCLTRASLEALLITEYFFSVLTTSDLVFTVSSSSETMLAVFGLILLVLEWIDLTLGALTFL